MASSLDLMDKQKFIKKWLAAFNAGDADAITEFYHDDAVNHQVNNQAVEGKTAIRDRFKEEFAMADRVCLIENIFNDGDWLILEWKDPLGLRGCGFFQLAENKIKFQRGYWDRLSFLRMHNLPLPKE